MSGWHHTNAKWQDKTCVVCSTKFTPKSGPHKFCSEKCKGKWQYITGSGATANQYEKISGNWDKYLARLTYAPGRKEEGLSKEILLKVLDRQDYKCALSGVPLECKLEVGVINKRNASVDRIAPGGPYTEENIQLVCKALNHWRSDTPLDDFVDWCTKVSEYQRLRRKGV